MLILSVIARVAERVLPLAPPAKHCVLRGWGVGGGEGEALILSVLARVIECVLPLALPAKHCG